MAVESRDLQENPSRPRWLIHLLLIVCCVAFGAAYKPYTAFGINPVDWLQLPQWWVMVLMLAPIGFLAINLVCGIFWTNTNPVDYQMAQMNARLQNLHELVKQSADVTVAARNDVVAVAMALGFAKDNNGKLVPPGSTIHDKLLAALTVLGAQQDTGTKRWKEPEKDVLDLLRRIEGAMVPHPVPSSSETKKVA